MKQNFVLLDEERRDRALEAVRTAEIGQAVIIQDSTRTNMQNALLHAVVADLSKQLMFMGKKRTLLQWKILLISGHAKATEDDSVEVLPGLEGEFVTFRESSAQMSKKRLSSLVEYIHAYGSMNNVIWSKDALDAVSMVVIK